MPKLLFLSRWFPYPADNGSKIRIYNLLQQLSDQFEIDLISFATESVADADRQALQGICQHVRTIPYRTFQQDSIKARLSFFAPQPRSVLDTYHPQVSAAIQELISKKSYAAVIASEVDMIPYVRAIPRERARLRVLEELEIATLYENNRTGFWPRLRQRLMWKKWQHYLIRQMRHFDLFTVVSQQELQKVSALFGDSITTPGKIIPNGVDLAHYAQSYPPSAPDSLVYAGALSFQANFDAVDYFLREIFPKIADQRPGAHLSITGKTEGVPIERLATSDQVTFTGYVDDIRPLIADHWASVVPLRFGGGTRLKILESLAVGTPVISTSKGSEGLDLIPGQDILIANSPEAFSAATLQVLSNPELRQSLSQQGRMAVAKYDWGQIGANLNRVLADALSKKREC